MGQIDEAQARFAQDTAREMAVLFRWDREEQMADAVEEIRPVIEAGFERYARAHHARLVRALNEPGRN